MSNAERDCARCRCRKVAHDEVVSAVGSQAVTFAQEITYRLARAPHISPVRDAQRHAADGSRVAGEKTQDAFARGRERDDHLIIEIVTA